MPRPLLPLAATAAGVAAAVRKGNLPDAILGIKMLLLLAAAAGAAAAATV